MLPQFLNGDDPNVMWMATQTSARIITFGIGTDNDVYATGISLDWPYGTRLVLHCGGDQYNLRFRLLGLPGIYAVLAAVAVALVEGRNLQEAATGLRTLTPTSGRLQTVLLRGGAYLLRDDFKSPLETVHSALDVLAAVPAPRKTIIIGAISEPMGSQGPIYREVGARLAEIADRVIVLGGVFQRYRAGAKSAGHNADIFIDSGHDLRGAFDLVRQDLQPEEVVLIKGTRYPEA